MWEKYTSWSKPVVFNYHSGDYYIHDGHHRLVAAYWLNRVDTCDHIINNYSVKKYLEINFDKTWVTPYNFVQCVRKSDFAEFKRVAMERRSEAWINENKHLYLEEREVGNLKELAQLYSPEVYIQKNPMTDSEKSLALPAARLYAFVRLAGTNFTIAGACLVGENRVGSYISLGPVQVYNAYENAIKTVESYGATNL